MSELDEVRRKIAAQRAEFLPLREDLEADALRALQAAARSLDPNARSTLNEHGCLKILGRRHYTRVWGPFGDKIYRATEAFYRKFDPLRERERQLESTQTKEKRMNHSTQFWNVVDQENVTPAEIRSVLSEMDLAGFDILVGLVDNELLPLGRTAHIIAGKYLKAGRDAGYEYLMAQAQTYAETGVKPAGRHEDGW